MQSISLDLASFNLHSLLECYFIFPKVYEVGTPPLAGCVRVGSAKGTHFGEGSGVTKERAAARVGKSLVSSQWWETVPGGLASELAQTSGSRDCDWHN